MKTLVQATTRELEIAQVKLAIVSTDAGIVRMETALAAMRQKQTARRCEVVRQETLARLPNDGTHTRRTRRRRPRSGTECAIRRCVQ